MIEMKVQQANLCLEEYINPLLPLLHMSYDDVRVPDTANIRTAQPYRHVWHSIIFLYF